VARDRDPVPLDRLPQCATNGACSGLTPIRFLAEPDSSTPRVAALVAGSDGRPNSVLHQPIDSDLSDHVQQVTRPGPATCNSALPGNGPIWNPYSPSLAQIGARGVGLDKTQPDGGFAASEDEVRLRG
jgi:hypothetical protein